MTKEQFIEECRKLGITITKDIMDKLDKFYKLMIIANNNINLTRITEEKEVYLKHYYDSLTLYKAVDLNKDLTLLDVGSGAGFPGVVLKIVFPNLKITLVDSLLKRVNYLNDVIKKIDLKDINAVHSRIEDYNKLGYKYDIVTSRAVARLSKLYNYCIPSVKENGLFIAMKANVEEELEEFITRTKIHPKQIEFLLPYENAKRNLIVVKK